MKALLRNPHHYNLT